MAARVKQVRIIGDAIAHHLTLEERCVIGCEIDPRSAIMEA